MTDQDSIREATDQLSATFGRLDALINNASEMPDFTTLSALDADLDAVRSAIEVDVMGPWALVQAVLPLLSAAPAARIVNVSSTSALQLATGLDLGGEPSCSGVFDGQAHAQRTDRGSGPGVRRHRDPGQCRRPPRRDRDPS